MAIWYSYERYEREKRYAEKRAGETKEGKKEKRGILNGIIEEKDSHEPSEMPWCQPAQPGRGF